MKRILYINIFIIGAAVLCAGETIGLEQARSSALANSRTLAKFKLATESALLDEKSQSYTNFPSLSLGLSASATLWGDGSGLPNSIGAGGSVSLSQTLWNSGKNSVLKAINKISTEITRKEALAEYFSVLDAADSAYYGVLKAQAAMDAADHSLEAAALSLSMAEVRLEGGIINYGDYLQAVAEHESKKTSRNQAKRDLALSWAQFRADTGITGADALEAVDFGSYESLIQGLSVFPDENFDLLTASLWAVVLDKNPSLSKAVLQTEMAGRSVTLASRDYLPSLSASISTGLSYSHGEGFTDSPGKLSISGSIPLDFWITKNNVDSKKIAQEQTLLDYKSTESSLDIEIQTRLLDCIAQAGSVLSSRKALEYSQKHYENVLELYRLSQGSVSELSDAAALVSSNQNQLINAQYGFLSCLSAIRSLGAFESEEQLVSMLMGLSA